MDTMTLPGAPSAVKDEAELVERARGGDAGALDQLTSRHVGAVYRLTLGILGDVAAAQDATQEACIKAVRALTSFRGDSSFRTWLLRIAANEARALLRRHKRHPEHALDEIGSVPAPGVDVAEQVVARDECARMRAALATLPEKQRMAVSLRVYDGLSFREIGVLIESSEGAARVNYHHGVRRLREMLR